MRNTFEQLDAIDALIEGWLLAGTIKQVYITTKFVEITQENNDELSFDWLITPFALAQNNTLFGSGGTTGNGMARNASDFINPIDHTDIPGIPANPATAVDNVSTNGIRSGDGAINRNSIDAILNNPGRTNGQPVEGGDDGSSGGVKVKASASASVK